MRGKADDFRVVARGHGITPACAGKSEVFRLLPDEGRDHPRMCGEKRTTAERIQGEPGSPPHVRGKVERIIGMDGKLGITPACAGKSRMKSILHL